MTRIRRFGFTLIELLVVVAIIALLISILLPSLSRARELSKRVVCASNARAIGNACKIYANEPTNQDQWPVPTHNEQLVPSDGHIAYADPFQLDPADPHAAMPPRETPTDESSLGETMSTTRSFWMLIRTGEVVPKSFICPSSGDVVDDTDEIDTYYDFQTINTVSYGYQVPFGPFDTRPSENVDTRMGLVADKGPYSGGGALPTDVTLDTPPREWVRFNSPNHGGTGAGEGQNVYFADGHVDFESTPVVGVDHDNIYTVMTLMATEEGRIIGGSPQGGGDAPSVNPWPGEAVFEDELRGRASTDSLIFP